jgi:hypothetical protein
MTVTDRQRPEPRENPERVFVERATKAAGERKVDGHRRAEREDNAMPSGAQY